MRSHWILQILILLALVPAACGDGIVRAGAQQQPTAKEPSVLVVTLSGKLGTPELARCHRTLRQAEAHNLSRVIFWLDAAGSQGEDEVDLQSLFDRMQSSSVATVAVVHGHVTQGAAYLALLCDSLYCTPNARFGELTQPEAGWEELFAASPEGAIAQRLDAFRDQLAKRLERRKNPLSPDGKQLALAMGDPRVQMIAATVRQGGIERERVFDSHELDKLRDSGASVVGDTPLTRPLILDGPQAEQYGLSSGTVQSLDDLAGFLLIDRDLMGELSTNWAEHMVGWLEMIQPFLLVAGFLLILLEVKTPGVGLPGVLGVLFLGLAMFYSYLVGLAEVTEILVFFLGLAALAVEIFLLPGTLIFGLIGFLCLVVSLVLSRQSFVLPSNAMEEGVLLHNLTSLTLLFVCVLVLTAVMWRVLPKVPYLNRVLLPAPQPAPSTGGSASGLGLGDASLTALVGRVGRAMTVLRPAGTAEIDGQRLDVVTEGEFVDPGVPVRVLYVQGTRIVVAAVAAGAVGGEHDRAGERGSVGVVLLLAIVGLALIVAEVLFVSFGVISVLAGVALIGAVFVGFQESTAIGVVALVGEAIAAPIVLAFAFKLLPRTRFGKEMILAGPTVPGSAAAADPQLDALLHKHGTTLSPLRPAGYARIEGHKVDVVTRGEMLDANVAIIVVEVAGNRVVVKQA